jgi:FkbM family methyltransferase
MAVSVFAFEPNVIAAAKLLENAWLNETAGKICVIPAAFAEAPLVQFVYSPEHTGAASLFGSRGSRSIPAVAVSDEVIAAVFARCSGKVVLKIDVEGAEAIVLQRLEDLGMLGKVDQIIIELSDNIRGEGYSESLIALLNSFGWAEVSRCRSQTHCDAIFVPSRSR